MPSRGQSITVQYYAWDTVEQEYKTGDVDNHTLFWTADGARAATENLPTEVHAPTVPGQYQVVLSSPETDCFFGTLAGESSTAGIIILPVSVGFDRFDEIKAKTDLIGMAEGGLLWPVDEDDEDITEVTIYPGDAYYVAEGRGFSVSIDATPPVLTGGTVKWICPAGENGQIQTEGNGTITGAGTEGSPYIVTAGDLTEASTAQLVVPSVVEARMVVTLANGHNIFVKRYKVTVPAELQPEVAP